MIHFTEINQSTLASVKRLLYHRNRTLPEYVEWKYGPGSPDGFRGIIAFIDGEEVGCFGSIPNQITIDSSDIIEIGWFADWYVKPTHRGKGLGHALLNQLTINNPIFLGHPGPNRANKICLEAGWKPLAYCVKMRWLLKASTFFYHRIQDSRKAIVQLALYQIKYIFRRFRDLPVQRSLDDKLVHVNISLPPYMKQWLINQPFVKIANRRIGEWHYRDVRIDFVDENTKWSGERYRRIIWVDPLSNLTSTDLSQFVDASRQAGITYIDMLVGTQNIANICIRSGSFIVRESPILCYGFSDKVSIPNLQGLHRENWLFRASQE